MNIVVMREPGDETRVALSPSSVKAYLAMDFKVLLEFGIGKSAGWSDEAYLLAGATLIENQDELLNMANILLSVNAPSIELIKKLNQGTLVITQVDYNYLDQLTSACKKCGIHLFILNHLPRITRAQSMDVLSSQSNLAGYRAVLLASYHFSSVIPMMMTAAGVILPAKVLVLGTGVAGLQAIATAKRLGAEVYAFDVRTATKEQVESLGAEFIEVDTTENLETQGGYAVDASDSYKKLQAQKIEEYAKISDIVISTALIPGQKSPLLLPTDTVKQMKPGSVIVDLGGNCQLTVKNEIVRQYGVIIIGQTNLAGQVPTTASELFSNNVFKVVSYIWDSENQIVKFDLEDPIIQQSLIQG